MKKITQFDDKVEQKERDKLKEYEGLEEQGLLLRLPCKVGDTVYTNTKLSGQYMREKDKPYEAKVVFIGINGVDNFMNIILEKGSMFQFKFSDLGKTVFLTHEEAEATLRKNKECNQNE